MRRSQLLLWLLIAMVLGVSAAHAQVQDDAWSEPHQLSTQDGTVIGLGGRPVADRFGNIHIVWGEESLIDGQLYVYYTVFDGVYWSEPIDILTMPPKATFGSLGYPVIDSQDRLNIIFTNSESGPITVMRAPIQGAASARNWSTVSQIDVNGYFAQLVIDDENVYHIAYIDRTPPEAGLYYMRSFSEGESWSQPIWLDPDVPPNYKPDTMTFIRDTATDDLHIMIRNKEVLGEEEYGKDLRHLYSTNNGVKWSIPTIIDTADEGIGELRADGVAFNIQNGVGHVVWSGTSETRREHRYTLDGGKTWSESARVFGELHGSAAGDSMLVDENGNFYFLAQIRYPQGIWQLKFADEAWSEPHLVYLIKRTSSEEYQGIHAHSIYSALGQGNMVMMTFTNSPADPHVKLYAMYSRLEGVAPEASLPMPTAVSNVTPTPTPVATANPVIVPTLPSDLVQVQEVSSPAMGVWVSIVPVTGLLLLIAGVTLLRKR